MRIWLAVLAALALGVGTAAADPLRAGAEAVRDKALTDPTAYSYVESLSVEVGERLAGSEAAARARDARRPRRPAPLHGLGPPDPHR